MQTAFEKYLPRPQMAVMTGSGAAMIIQTKEKKHEIQT